MFIYPCVNSHRVNINLLSNYQLMDVSKIISISRKQTWGTSASQISDVDYLDYLNIVYKDIFSRLTVNSKKYTRQTANIDLVANQSEYTIPALVVADWTTGLKKVVNIYVNYGNWEVEAKIHNTTSIDTADYTDESTPYAINRDGSVFIYPAPTANVTAWLRIEWSYIPLDLELLTASANIKLQPEYHDIMINGINGYVFGEKRLFDKQIMQKQMYDEWIKMMKTEWAMDIESAYIEEEADFSSLE